MAAVKFIRSIQDWAYKSFGHEHAVAIVAMATPEDMRIDAEHIKMADQFVEVPGGSNNNNYANVRLIVQTAEKANVDAVWPGWSVLFFTAVLSVYAAYTCQLIYVHSINTTLQQAVLASWQPSHRCLTAACAQPPIIPCDMEDSHLVTALPPQVITQMQTTLWACS